MAGIGLPLAFPDELLFSRLVRYCTLHAIPVSQLLNKIYGDSRASINPILTAGLDCISSIFAEDKEIMLREQTLAPLFMHYYPHYSKKLKAALSSRDNYAAIRVSQLSCVKAYSKLTIKMCPLCAKQDIRHHGVAYWHRGHQIPAIESCSEHQLQLVHISLPQRFKLAVGLPSVSESEHQPSSDVSYSLAKYAKQVLVNQSKHASELNSAFYRNSLAKLGYITQKDRIRRVKLLSDFFEFADNAQEPFNSALPTSASDFKYITNLVYDKHSQHIFKHLAFEYWLINKQEGRKSTVTKKPITATPSKQLEAECYSLLKKGLGISDVSRKIGKSRTFVKRFAYAYGFEDLLLPRKLNPSVRSYIIFLAWKGFHRFEIARRLSVSTGSVEMLISSVDGLVEWRKQCKYESTRRRHKCCLIRYRKHFPQRLRKDIKRDCGAAFYWLYLHEPDWLESMLPVASLPTLHQRAKK